MRPKVLLIVSMLMMLTPSFLYWIGPLRRPAMADGDRLTMLACPQCQGQGVVQGKTCSRCRGKKQVQHLVPGPHRPTYLEGCVYAPDRSTPVADAEVQFQSPAGSWTRRTDQSGRFGADLPPGKYPLTIQSAQGKVQTVVEIAPQVDPSPVDTDPRFPQRQQAFYLEK